MGNKLFVDSKVTDLSDILNFPMENLKEEIILPDETSNYQNLKVWKFYEDTNDKVKHSALEITKISEEHFLFSSYEAYIILLVSHGLDKNEDDDIFPSSLWGIVESSSNMTPRGLKYVFSSSSESDEKCENLESFMVSNRDLKGSNFNYVIFIWNGKKTNPMVKSTVMMHAFDLDKKLTGTKLLSRLYFGDYIEPDGKDFEPGQVVCLNNYVHNTIESPTKKLKKDGNTGSVPSSGFQGINLHSAQANKNEKVDKAEKVDKPKTSLKSPKKEFRDFHETVYLLQWLYPNGRNPEESKQPMQKKTLYPKFNESFLRPVNVDYYSCFTPIDSFGNKIKTKIEDTDDTEQVDQDNFDLDDIDLTSNPRTAKKDNIFNLDMKNKMNFKLQVPNLHMEIKQNKVNDGIYLI